MNLNNNKEFVVYKHTTPNNKVYIGITSQPVQNRWGKNGNGYKGQLFHRAVLKYGWDNIKHEVLFTHLSKEEAFQKEIELIAKYNSTDGRYGYNVSNGGDGIGDDYSYLCVSVNMYDKQGNFLKTYESISEAEEEIGVTGIGECLRGKRKTIGGYVWRYPTDSFDKYSCESKVLKPVVQYDINGNYIAEFESIEQAKNQTNVRNISTCVVGRKKTSGGFVWRYKGDPFDKYDVIYKQRGIPIKQYNLDGTYIKTYPSQEAASQETGINAGHISSVCSGKRISCGGYIWRYKNDGFDTYRTEREISDDRRVYQYDLSGNLVNTYKWSADAVAQYGNGVSKCLCGRYKTAYGYIWKREGEQLDISQYKNKQQNICILQFDLNKNLIRQYQSINDIPIPSDKSRNTYISKVKEVLSNKRKTAYGYIWRYRDEVDVS